MERFKANTAIDSTKGCPLSEEAGSFPAAMGILTKHEKALDAGAALVL
jgi:hypothetical protein